MSQIADVVVWWLALQLFGLAALPLTLRVFRNLPGTAWAFARPVGILAAGFLFWQGGTFGVLRNEWASILGALMIVAAIAWILCWREVVGLGSYVRAARSQVVAIEALFTLAFAFWAIVRAYNPEIAGTEKPMDFLFLNGVLRSEQFPPIDPWLSGFAISYYYFGYLITAMLTRFTGVAPGIAFNLMHATLFALTATGAYAIGAALYAGSRGVRATVRRTVGAGLLAVMLVLIAGNLEPVVETLNGHGMLSPEARDLLQIQDLPPPYQSATLFPGEDNFNWMWRSTRVIWTPSPRDYTITEFPYFSFTHADLHPHVMALPFVFLAIGFALNLLLSPGTLSLASLRRDPWTVAPALVLFGALGFLNAWDLPTFLFLLALAFGVHRVLSRGALDRQVVREVMYGLPGAFLLCVLTYLPFYFGFRSQVSGLGIVFVHSQVQHFFLFWGPLYLLVATFVGAELAATWRATPAGDWSRNRYLAVGVLLVSAVCFALSAPVVGLVLPFMVGAVALVWRHTLAAPVPVPVAAEVPRPRAVRRRRTEQPVEIAGGALPIAAPREHLFVMLMAFTGLLLIFGCELFFVRDLFNDRMNTVFKLYYQAWTLLALAAAYAIPYWLGRLGALGGAARVGLTAWSVVLGLVMLGTLIYPYAATMTKTHGFRGEPTLDGTEFWGRIRPDELAAIRWLQSNVEGAPVIVEASGDSYRQEFGRVSSMTGLPTILGWPGHENQWRGTYDEQARRQPDLDAIYTSTDQRNVLSLLEKYGVTYLFVGQSERDKYRAANLDRFAQFMDPVYKQGNVTIYRVRSRAA